ncbi:MAG: hypothetical protein ABR606_15630 [Vicinamibacterales bacterium]
MMMSIVIGSTVKGVLTGAMMGLVARRLRSLTLGVLVGLSCGWVLSSLAALGQTWHSFEIVLPGMLLGAIVGFVTQRYPQPGPRSAGGQAAGLVLLPLLLLPATVGGEQGGNTDPLQPLAFMVGRWEGTSDGRPGKTRVLREYKRALNSRFILGHNRSEYPPQEKNPSGIAASQGAAGRGPDRRSY